MKSYLLRSEDTAARDQLWGQTVIMSFCCWAAASGKVSPNALGKTSAWVGEGSALWLRKSFQIGQMSAGQEGIQ